MSFRHYAVHLLLTLGVVLPWKPLVAQATVPERALREWAAADQRWLNGQVTPNRVVPSPDPSRRRLLISYDISPEKSPRGFHRSATYDNALAALVFLIRGDRDRAAFTLHALARLVRPDGSLWVGYNTANNWPDESDTSSALIRAGAVGWAGYALTFYLAHAAPCAGDRGCERERALFLETATRLGNYLFSLQVNSPGDPRDGLLRLGFGAITLAYHADINNVVEIYDGHPALGISTENNISSWFFLRQLAALTGEARWSQAAEHIQAGLVRNVWSDALGQFNQGFAVDGTADRSKALDCASWGALFLLAAGEAERARAALHTIESTYKASSGRVVGYRPYDDQRVYGDPEVAKFFFPDNPGKEWRDLPLVWSEGTLGAALVHLRAGQVSRAREVIAGLSALQQKETGLQYASMAVPYQMNDAPSVAASAWLILVAEALARNPLAEQIWK